MLQGLRKSARFLDQKVTITWLNQVESKKKYVDVRLRVFMRGGCRLERINAKDQKQATQTCRKSIFATSRVESGRFCSKVDTTNTYCFITYYVLPPKKAGNPSLSTFCLSRVISRPEVAKTEIVAADASCGVSG